MGTLQREIILLKEPGEEEIVRQEFVKEGLTDLDPSEYLHSFCPIPWPESSALSSAKGSLIPITLINMVHLLIFNSPTFHVLSTSNHTGIYGSRIYSTQKLAVL